MNSKTNGHILYGITKNLNRRSFSTLLKRAVVIHTHFLIVFMAHILVSTCLVNSLDNGLEAQTDTKIKCTLFGSVLPTLL